ncbi:MAG: hypothetical protein IT174_02930 [Acidobacteria bacterium]|nr:hypothetical protein [Acidobacteriota bacterium]
MFPIRENELPINMSPEAGQDLDFINAAFDNFFETVEQKETDQGTMLFSKVGRDADPFEGNDVEEVRRQMDAVKEVRDDRGRLLAPNGKVSNLPEHLWKAVRTPFFRRYAGEWELMQKQTPVHSISRHSFSDLKDAEAYAVKHVLGEYQNSDTGNIIQVSKRSIDKFLSPSSTQKSSSLGYHLATLRVIPDLINDSILVEEHPDNSKRKEFTIQRYYGAVQIGDDLRRVKLTVRAYLSGSKRNYTYEVSKIEELGGSLSESTDGPKALSRTPSVSMATVLQGARKNNGDLWDTTYTKALDENGEPKIFYHGTHLDFEEFNPNLIGLNFDDASVGFYFTDVPDRASEYANLSLDDTLEPRSGANVMPVFLNIRRPLTFFDTEEGRSSESYLDHRSDVITAKESGRNDGAIASTAGGRYSSTVAVAFDPNQAKSIFNRGTYSESNNMLFSKLGRAVVDRDTEAFGLYIERLLNGDLDQSQKAGMVLSGTPSVYRSLGAKDLPIALRYKAAKKILVDKHALAPDVLGRVPYALTDPVAVVDHIDADTGKRGIRIFTDLKDTNGYPVVVGLDLNQRFGSRDLHIVPTVFGNTRVNVDAAGLRYVNEKKLQEIPILSRIASVYRESAKANSKILTDADFVKPQDYTDASAFAEARWKKQNAFRDTHRAPSADFSPADERLEGGGDFSLAEVAAGISPQPIDYFSLLGERYYGDGSPSSVETRRIVRDVAKQIESGTPVESITVKAYRAVPNKIDKISLSDGDWIGLSKAYAVDHGELRFGEGEYRIISQEVPVSHVWWDGNDATEWGYDSGTLWQESEDVWNADPSSSMLSSRLGKNAAPRAFHSRTKEAADLLRSLATAHTQDILEGARSNFEGDDLYLNEHASEEVRRLLAAEAYSFSGEEREIDAFGGVVIDAPHLRTL